MTPFSCIALLAYVYGTLGWPQPTPLMCTAIRKNTNRNYLSQNKTARHTGNYYGACAI